MLEIPIIQVSKVSLEKILPFRALFINEANCQIRYNACHERGWTDSYLVTVDGLQVGYGSVKGKDDLTGRNAIFEFYVLPSFRQYRNDIFGELISVSKACFIECQSNDVFLTSLQYRFAQNIIADVILFEDSVATNHFIPGVTFRAAQAGDKSFGHKSEPNGTHVLERDGEVVATGGFLLHYNVPFADLYMEVREDCRNMGYGSFLLQEVKKQCYLAGRVPAARCDITNTASKATLLKAGLTICGYMLTGQLKQ